MTYGLIGIYWVKCKQTKLSHRSDNFVLTFSSIMIIRPWLNLSTGVHGHVICIGILVGVFSREYTPKGITRSTKVFFFSYKHVSGRNGDHEWLRMTNAFILCDLLWRVQKCHAPNREGSFNHRLKATHRRTHYLHVICITDASLINKLTTQSILWY